MKTLMLAVLLACGLSAQVIGTKIPKLENSDGKILHNVIIVSVGSSSVMAKWDGGRGAIRMDDLPPDVRAKVPKIEREPETITTADESVRTRSSAIIEALRRAPPVFYSDYPEPPAISQKMGAAMTLAGQVFITTKAGTSVKFAGVPVWIYSVADYNAQKRWFEQGPLTRTDIHFERIKFFQANDTPGAVKAELETVGAIINSSMNTMRRPPAATVTDADGRFTITHTIDGPFVVICCAKRLIGGEDEYTRWEVMSKDILEPRNLLLNNANSTD